MSILTRADLAFGAAVAAAAAGLFASAWAAEALGLIFHLHPAAVPIIGAIVYLRTLGERPCTTRSISFLFLMAALIAIYQGTLAPLGLADPPAFTAAVALAGIAVAARILLRADRIPAMEDTA
ncbi:MAG: hypothetical protein WEE03_02330 [Chloroflexota bacterium]